MTQKSIGIVCKYFILFFFLVYLSCDGLSGTETDTGELSLTIMSQNGLDLTPLPNATVVIRTREKIGNGSEDMFRTVTYKSGVTDQNGHFKVPDVNSKNIFFVEVYNAEGMMALRQIFHDGTVTRDTAICQLGGEVLGEVDSLPVSRLDNFDIYISELNRTVPIQEKGRFASGKLPSFNYHFRLLKNQEYVQSPLDKVNIPVVTKDTTKVAVVASLDKIIINDTSVVNLRIEETGAVREQGGIRYIDALKLNTFLDTLSVIKVSLLFDSVTYQIENGSVKLLPNMTVQGNTFGQTFLIANGSNEIFNSTTKGENITIEDISCVGNGSIHSVGVSGSFVNSRFEGLEFSGFVKGIEVDSTSGLIVKNCSFSQTDTSCVINGKSQNVTIIDAFVRGHSEGVGIVFNGTDSNRIENVKISRSQFRNLQKGAIFYNVGNWSITDNTFDKNKRSIHLDDWSLGGLIDDNIFDVEGASEENKRPYLPVVSVQKRDTTGHSNWLNTLMFKNNLIETDYVSTEESVGKEDIAYVIQLGTGDTLDYEMAHCATRDNAIRFTNNQIDHPKFSLIPNPKSRIFWLRESTYQHKTFLNSKTVEAFTLQKAISVHWIKQDRPVVIHIPKDSVKLPAWGRIKSVRLKANQGGQLRYREHLWVKGTVAFTTLENPSTFAMGYIADSILPVNVPKDSIVVFNRYPEEIVETYKNDIPEIAQFRSALSHCIYFDEEGKGTIYYSHMNAQANDDPVIWPPEYQILIDVEFDIEN